MALKKPTTRKPSKVELNGDLSPIKRLFNSLMDGSAIGVLSVADAIKVLRRERDDASDMSPDELQRALNDLINSAAPTSMAIVVHVEGADCPLLRRSQKLSYQVADDVAEIASLLRYWRKIKPLNLLGI